MRGFKFLVLAVVAGALFTANLPKAAAQVTVEVGVAPDCPYGYYDYAPYSCVPDGYYNSFDPNHGYNGARPKVGDKAAAQRRDPAQFKGNETRDGRGHSGGEKK